MRTKKVKNILAHWHIQLFRKENRMLVEGFREFLERNFNNDKELVSVLYKKLRYIELMVFHKWAVYIGAKISKGKKWEFVYSDHNIEDLKELIKEMENNISKLELGN